MSRPYDPRAPKPRLKLPKGVQYVSLLFAAWGLLALAATVVGFIGHTLARLFSIGWGWLPPMG